MSACGWVTSWVSVGRSSDPTCQAAEGELGEAPWCHWSLHSRGWLPAQLHCRCCSFKVVIKAAFENVLNTDLMFGSCLQPHCVYWSKDKMPVCSLPWGLMQAAVRATAGTVLTGGTLDICSLPLQALEYTFVLKTAHLQHSFCWFINGWIFIPERTQVLLPF